MNTEQAIEIWREKNLVLHCEAYHCDVALQVCIDRQAAVSGGAKRGKFGAGTSGRDFIACEKCKQGREKLREHKQLQKKV